jgi:hypothetical protein
LKIPEVNECGNAGDEQDQKNNQPA